MINIIKGADVTFKMKVYSDEVSLVLAGLGGATIKTYLKRSPSDLDAAALVTATGTVTDPVGFAESSFTAAQTNTLTIAKAWLEHVVKLANGKYIRSGAVEVGLLQNVGKTLF